jgi:hypothetical protein
MKVVSSVYVIIKWRFYKYKAQNKLMIEPNVLLVGDGRGKYT